jgi:serine/threonine protein kinase
LQQSTRNNKAIQAGLKVYVIWSSLLQEHVKREKQIMAECDCPFMVNLVTSFKDDSHLYMLMECVMGGELFTYLQSRPGPLKEDHARFYAASVVLGLEYMQERNLLWRLNDPRLSTAYPLPPCLSN